MSIPRRISLAEQPLIGWPEEEIGMENLRRLEMPVPRAWVGGVVVFVAFGLGSVVGWLLRSML